MQIRSKIENLPTDNQKLATVRELKSFLKKKQSHAFHMLLVGRWGVGGPSGAQTLFPLQFCGNNHPLHCFHHLLLSSEMQWRGRFLFSVE